MTVDMEEIRTKDFVNTLRSIFAYIYCKLKVAKVKYVKSALLWETARAYIDFLSQRGWTFLILLLRASPLKYFLALKSQALKELLIQI